jgi:hypothetical protein
MSEIFEIIKAVNRLTDKVIENSGKIDSLLSAFSRQPSQDLNGQYVNEETACAILHRCPNTLLNLRKNGDLPYLKVGKKVLYKLSDLKSFLENNYSG